MKYPLQPPMFTASPGVVPDMTEKSPLDFFRLYFDECVMDLILTETTRYVNQNLERDGAP